MVAITVSDYLSSTFDPDVDYVDGELEDRHVGEKDHLRLQLRVMRHLEGCRGFVTTRCRIRISPTRYRVPDVCVYQSKPAGLCTVPWIVVEILSLEDRMSRMQRKLEDYYTTGCPHIWLLDPWLCKAFRFDGSATAEVSELASEDGRVTLMVAQLF